MTEALIEAEAEKIIETLMRRHGLFDPERTGGMPWTWRWSSSIKNLGVCAHSTRTLSFSRYWCKKLGRDEFVDTVLHEIAHSLAGHAAGHGHKWEAIFRAIGGTGRRKSDWIPKELEPWQGICDNKKHSVSASKKPTNLFGGCVPCMIKTGEIVRFHWTFKDRPVMLDFQTRTYKTMTTKTTKTTTVNKPAVAAFDRGFTDPWALGSD